MEFNELLKSRRSIRLYKNEQVKLETIKAIINDSVLAPSAGNEQPCKFIIVNNKVLIDRISDNCKSNILERIAANPNDYAKKYENMLLQDSFNIFYNAPSLVYILGEAKLKNLYVDCALVASYFMMSASSRGLGTCWINFGKEIRDPEILSNLGITENYQIVAPIILGYPLNIPQIPKRNKVEIINTIT
jgi:nitroreductase